ncbi:hypothetical protein KUTeg_022987 [Tegillarca granosa]|uniref:DDT domain-containing protein n=1 Tax=Tegillarca granosa TaxID=220873 RepID=A0ABQ9E0Z1_TEGGR|nr:hypothetical protein KUTeg_022987 [Tegillarca granosa]
MTPEEKAEYFRQKRMESKKRMREKQNEMRRRFEDQDLEQKALPQPKLVSTPDGLPNELFGDVAMVTEFISCYAGLLMPDDEYPIFTDALMKALCSGKEGFTYLSRVLVVLLQTLLQDQISEDYHEIKVPLSDIPVNPYTSSELVRLCLRKQDVDDGNSDVSDSEDLKEEEEVVRRIYILRLIPNHFWKRKMAELKQKNDQLKKEKEQKKEAVSKRITFWSFCVLDALLSMFYGGSAEKGDSSRPSTPDITSAESTADEGTNSDDLASIVKRRRLMTAKAAAEKEKIEQEKRKLKEKEYEQYKKQMEKERFQKEFDEGIRLAKMVLRQCPIGTDRNHNRYWVFSATTPGLYIEKGKNNFTKKLCRN